MWAATALDDKDWEGARARGWTVMGRLRERQRFLGEEARAARRRLSEQRGQVKLMTAAAARQDYEDSIRARWTGGPTVLAFLFAPLDSDALRMLDARGDYFDQRTGDTWDLFFPGYYKSPESASFELQTGAGPVGRSYADDWYFNAGDFDIFRSDIERCSNYRWEYSGGTDLVLVNGWLVRKGEPTIDWASTISGQVTERAASVSTLPLGTVIERISRDLENVDEDKDYGVGEVTRGVGAPRRSTVGRDLMIGALGGIAAKLGAGALGAG